MSNVLLTEPIDYIPFARLLERATLAISDSGGVKKKPECRYPRPGGPHRIRTP